MNKPGPFLSEQHPVSRRHAIFEDDGVSAWLYLSAPDQPIPVAEVWVYNRGAPPAAVQRGAVSGPPPIIQRFAGNEAVVADPNRHQWQFRWVHGGDSVGLMQDGVLVAVILAGDKRGRCANITTACPWGSPLGEEVTLVFMAADGAH